MVAWNVDKIFMKMKIDGLSYNIKYIEVSFKDTIGPIL